MTKGLTESGPTPAPESPMGLVDFYANAIIDGRKQTAEALIQLIDATKGRGKRDILREITTSFSELPVTRPSLVDDGKDIHRTNLLTQEATLSGQHEAAVQVCAEVSNMLLAPGLRVRKVRSYLAGVLKGLDCI